MERERNLTDAFEISPKVSMLLKDKKILLLDDIYTTGATSKECAKTLLEAGAGRIDFLALSSAKSKRHENFPCKEGLK